MNLYSRKELAVVAFASGLLVGMVVAFSACSPDPDEANTHITTGAHQ